MAVAVLLVVGQFFPPERTNPPLNPEGTFEVVAKPGPEVISIVRRACYDCHSNSTVWLWYSRVVPVFWLVAEDVVDGRAYLNFSQWNLLSPEAAKQRMMGACEEVRRGDMPLWQYRIIHPEARLTEEDVRTICAAVGQPVGNFSGNPKQGVLASDCSYQNK